MRYFASEYEAQHRQFGAQPSRVAQLGHMAVGYGVGRGDGSVVGKAVGVPVGTPVGSGDGGVVGVAVGSAVGTPEGAILPTTSVVTHVMFAASTKCNADEALYA